jgi:hypothetical protein
MDEEKTTALAAEAGRFLEKALERTPPLIERARPKHQALQDACLKWDEDWEKGRGFNLFADLTSGITEVNHSRILAKFLNPRTLYGKQETTSNPEFLKCFVNLLVELLKESKQTIDIKPFFTDKAEVVADSDDPNKILPHPKIDLYIEEGNRCIIIENKITGKAGDRSNQMGRYFNCAMAKDKDVIAVVYLPLFEKQPPDDYEGDFKKEFYERRVILPAIDMHKKCLIKDFLDPCAGLVYGWGKEKGGYTAAVCLEQYSQLIQRNGDKNLMAEKLRLKLLEKVLSCPDSKEIVADIVDVWNDRHNLLAGEFKEALHKEMDFKEQEIMPGETYLAKPIDGSDLVLYFHYDSTHFQIGFGCKTHNMAASNLRKKLDRVMRSKEDAYLMPNSLNIVSEGDDWVYSDILFEKLKGGTLAETRANLIGYYKFLETEAKRIVEATRGVSK